MWYLNIQSSLIYYRNTMKRIEQEHVNGWILHFLEGKATEEEMLSLKQWIAASEANKKYYQQIKNIWDVSDKNIANLDISTDEAFDHVLDQITEKPLRTINWMVQLRKIAAILIIPMILGSFFAGKYFENKKAIAAVAYNEIYAPLGTRSNVTLSDGSKVWLNSGSKLRYPDKFISGKRIVHLTGEAFFEVNADVKRPFIVKTSSVSIGATGTAFNVQALQSDGTIKVSLVTGKVAVNKNSLRNEAQLLGVLSPNQIFSYDTLTGKVQTYTGDIYQNIAWKDGRLVFRNVALSEVVKKISQMYNVEIELQGKELQDYRYRATFEEESLNEILKLLKLSSPVKYKEIRRTLLPDGTFTKRKIIIYPL